MARPLTIAPLCILCAFALLVPAPASASPQPPPPEPSRTLEERIVPAETVLGLQIETTVSTDEAKVEDPIEAKVTRDVRVGDSVAIPAGTRVLGSVVVVERGSKIKNKARLGVRFHALVMADAAATRVPIHTDTIYRESESQEQRNAARISAAVVSGAILGAIIGGGKGAAIGGALGAGAGTASVLSGEHGSATLRAGAAVTVCVLESVTVPVER